MGVASSGRRGDIGKLPAVAVRDMAGNHEDSMSYQEDLRTPGRNPACACSRRLTRESPNARK